MAAKVEEAAAAILKDELGSLENWIRDQQNNLKDEIMKIEGAYEETRKNLLATGAFSEDEVKDQLSAVQKKADAKKETYDNYEDLLKRSQNIYSWPWLSIHIFETFHIKPPHPPNVSIQIKA